MVDTRWLNEDETQMWLGYRRMRVLLDLHINRDLANDSGLSEADYDVLSTLTEGTDHSWRANELAARLLWSTSRLSHHVGRMEGRGLIHREQIASDGRGSLVRLTDAGWQALHAAAPHHLASVRRHLVDLLTPIEIAAIGSAAAKVLAHFDDAHSLAAIES